MAAPTLSLAQAYAEALGNVREKISREGDALVHRYARDTATLVLLLQGAVFAHDARGHDVASRRATDRALYHWRMVRRVLRYTAPTPVYTGWFAWSTLHALRAHAPEVLAALDQFNHLVAQAQKCLAQERSS